MILSNYNFPTIADQLRIHELGGQEAEHCRSVVVDADGRTQALMWCRDKASRSLRLRHPKPMSEIQAVTELEDVGEGHRVVEIMIYVALPTLSELGIEGDPDLRLNSHQNWYFRIPACEGHIVGQVQVLELVKGDGETHYAPIQGTLEAHHVDAQGHMHMIDWPRSDAWVQHLIDGGFRR